MPSPFKLHPLVSEIKKEYMAILKARMANVEKCMPLKEVKPKPRSRPEKLDKKNRAVFDFYAYLIVLEELPRHFEHPWTCHDELIKDFDELINKIKIEFTVIQKNPDMLLMTHGVLEVDAIYRLLSFHILHKSPDIKFFNVLINFLKENARSPSEIQILDYLSFWHVSSSSVKEECEVKADKNNPLIRAHTILYFEKNSAEKFNKLKKLDKFFYEKNILPIIRQIIEANLRCGILNNTEQIDWCYANPKIYTDTIKKLTELQYISLFLKILPSSFEKYQMEDDFKVTLYFILETHNFFEHLNILSSNYALLTDNRRSVLHMKWMCLSRWVGGSFQHLQARQIRVEPSLQANMLNGLIYFLCKGPKEIDEAFLNALVNIVYVSLRYPLTIDAMISTLEKNRFLQQNYAHLNAEYRALFSMLYFIFRMPEGGALNKGFSSEKKAELFKKMIIESETTLLSDLNILKPDFLKNIFSREGYINLQVAFFSRIFPLQQEIALFRRESVESEKFYNFRRRILDIARAIEVDQKTMDSLEKMLLYTSDHEGEFKPCKTLASVESLYLANHSRRSSRNEYGMNKGVFDPPLKFIEFDEIIDDENRVLIILFCLLIYLDFKAEGFLKNEPSEKSIEDLYQSEVELHDLADKIKNKYPRLWRYLLKGVAGRHALSSLVHRDIVNTRRLLDKSILLIEALQKTSQHPDEAAFWEHLKNRLNPDYLNKNTEEAIDLSSIKNIYSQIDILLRSDKSFKEKSLKLKKLTKISFAFPALIPDIFKSFMRALYLSSILLQPLSRKEDNKWLDSIIAQLIAGEDASSYKEAYSRKHERDRWFQLGLYLQDLNQLIHDYVMFLDLSGFMMMQKQEITIQYILAFMDVKGDFFLSQWDRAHLIAEPQNFIESDFFQAELLEEKKALAPAIVRCFSTLSLTDFQIKLESVVANLYVKKEKAAIIMLENFLASDMVFSRKNYNILLSVVLFISHLSLDDFVSHEEKMDNENSQHVMSSLVKILTAFEYLFDEFLSFIDVHFKELKQQIQTRFVERISALEPWMDFYDESDEITSFDKFQSNILRVASILKIDEASLKKIETIIRHDDHHFFEFLEEDAVSDDSIEEYKTAPDRKTKSKSYVPHFHFFKKLPVDDAIIKKECFPKMVNDFSCEFKELTSRYLILGGGVIPHYFHKKPGDPNDFDGIVLDEDINELFSHYSKDNRYEECKMEPEHVPPLIRLVRREGERLIKIDLTFYKTDGKPFDEAMRQIMGLRDYDESALFVLMTGEDLLRIRGFNHSVRSLRKKQFALVKHDKDIFKSDVTRLLRLNKMMAHSHEHTFHQELKIALEHEDFVTLFADYINHETRSKENIFSINRALHSLCTRVHFTALIDIMGKVPTIAGLTGLRYKFLLPTLPALIRCVSPYENYSPSSAKLNLYYFFYIHYCLLERYKKVPVKDRPFVKVIYRSMPATEKPNLEFIAEKLIRDREISYICPTDRLKAMINTTQESYKAFYENEPEVKREKSPKPRR